MPLPKDKPKKKKTVKGAFQEIGLPKLPEVLCIALDTLLMDGNYQRITNGDRVDKYSKKFNPILCGVLIVSKRSSGKEYLIDGGHRRATCQKLGYKHWHAYVLTGLNSEEEAELYEALNVDRKNATSIERFKARLHYKDPVAVTIKSTVERMGFELELCPGRRGGRIVHAVTALDNIFRRSNRPGLETVLNVISSCWDEDEFGATDAVTLRGIHLVLTNKRWKEKVNVKHLISRLQKISVNKLLRKARGYHDSQGGSIVGLFADAVVVENNKKLRKTANHWLPPRGMEDD